MYVRQLTDPTEEEIEITTRTLIDSVGENLFCQAGCGWDPSILWENFRARVSFGCKDGWVYVAGREVGKIEAAVYINPFGWEFGSSNHAPDGKLPRCTDRMKPDRVQWLTEDFVPWFHSHCKRAFGAAGMKDYLYVNLLGVTPSAQGSGLGYALMVHVIEMADEQKVPMSLITQTESNMKWYARLGFEVTWSEIVDLPPHGELPSWGLVRPARTA